MNTETSKFVSAVIPCYNQSVFLGEAIESVLGQTHRQFEIIVVDDGSSDNTSEVAARYIGVRTIRQENRGLAAARNVGLQASSGDYLVFLDADDRLLSNALECGLNSFETHPECAFVSGGCRLISGDGSHIPGVSPYIERDYYLELLRENFIWGPTTVMYRRSVLQRLGGFDSSSPGAEDYDLSLRIARSLPVHCYRDIIAERREHGANMTRNYSLMTRSTMAVFRSQRKYIKGDKAAETAYRDGLITWQYYYARKLEGGIKANLSAGDWQRAMHNIVTLVQYCPRGLLRRLLFRLRSSLGLNTASMLPGRPKLP